MASDLLKIERMRKRPQFLAAAKAHVYPRGAVLAQGRARRDEDPTINIGFTATRKIGGSVVRNRAKRRLREAARALVSDHGVPGSDYVLIARMGTAAREWPRLLDDVKSALTRLATAPAPPAGTSGDTPSAARDKTSQDR